MTRGETASWATLAARRKPGEQARRGEMGGEGEPLRLPLPGRPTASSLARCARPISPFHAGRFTPGSEAALEG
jgi:hypothetical protein